MIWEIRYYLTEEDYKAGKIILKEQIEGTREYASVWAANRKKNSGYALSEILRKS